MKKLLSSYIVACSLCLVTVNSFAQTIPFSKNERQDSTALAHVMIELAKKTIPLYQDINKSTYKDNLFRLHIVAQDYRAVAPILREVGQEAYGDSTKIRAIGIPYRLFANTMLAQPKDKAAFEHLFTKQFEKLYATFDAEAKEMVGEYYEKDFIQLKADFDGKLMALKDKDAIAAAEAMDLCRSYCSYLTFSATYPTAQKLLKALDDEKYIIEDSVLIPMKDGGNIATTIVRPKNSSTPLPVVMLYNIYAGSDIPSCKEAANKGYVGIVANTRGKRLSTDAIEPFEHDAKDAYEIIDWISKQPWCNGKVGMNGGSYLGFSQWSAVKYKHPALKTIVPQVAVGAGIDYPMQNGVFMSYMLRWIHFVTNNKLTDFADFNNDVRWDKVFKEYYTLGKPFNTLDQIDGRRNELFQRWLQHPVFDSFWQNMTPTREEFAAIDIPILTTTGYFDDDQLGALYYYKEYQKYNKRDNYYLIIGPYDHGGAQGYPKTSLLDYTIDEAANISIQQIVYQWFDYILKDGPKPELLQDKVNYELMGANQWKHAPSFEKMHNAELTFYLGKNNQLTAIPENTSGYIEQQIDFKIRDDYEPVDANKTLVGFEALQPLTLHKKDTQIVLESAPLTEPIAITGSAKAYLDLAINKKDLDITFELYEHKPDGTYFALSSNLARASHTRDKTKRQLLTPNLKESIVMENNFLACRQLQKGSRLVLLIGVNKSPDWQINYGTGKDVSLESIEDAKEPLNVKWFYSSKIVIPVVK